MIINIKDYGPIISDKDVGANIYLKIVSILSDNQIINIDFDQVVSMATFCAKQIFGKLYIELGPDVFFEKIKLINVSDDLKIIIKMGIQNAIEESSNIKDI